MRDDLLDAKSSIQWAEAQMHMLQVEFINWQRTNPYEIICESDPETGQEMAVAICRQPFPGYLIAGVGSIINSARSSLDILAAALARRNGKVPTSEHHFPVRKIEADFRTLINDIKAKGWLSASDIQKIETLRPYKGGDDSLWPMHKLDTLRKHERLVSASGEIRAFHLLGPIASAAQIPVIKRLEDKTFLCPMTPENVARITQGNSLFAVDITLNESAIGLVDEPARPTLQRFIVRAKEVIALFG